MTDHKAMLAGYENLGDNCEFGIVQRLVGIEPLGLLRLAGTPYVQFLTAAMESRFAGFGDPGEVELFGQDGGNFGVHIKNFHVIYATPIRWSTVDAANVLSREIAKINLLKRKLMEDLEEGHKVFVRKGTKDSREQIVALSKAMRRYGPNTLLWVTEADENHPNGSLEAIEEGLVAGRVAKFAPPENVLSLVLPDWIALCENYEKTFRPSAIPSLPNGAAAAPVELLGHNGVDKSATTSAGTNGHAPAVRAAPAGGMLTRPAIVQALLDLFPEPSYLEIGVDSGHSLGLISASHTVAVDPNLKFVPPPDASTVEYHAIGSDDYFASHCPAGKSFDVVFLDGQHTFEQTLRDLLNAVLRLSDGGVIVVDDILPVSYHASLPKLNEAFQLRDHLAPHVPAHRADNTWMGDVYKLAFFVQTFMQQLSYATVQETQGPLVLWKSVRPGPPIPDRTMLDIALLNFSDTVLKRSAFRILPFDSILDEIQAHHARLESLPDMMADSSVAPLIA
jgi:hypothetical protein